MSHNREEKLEAFGALLDVLDECEMARFTPQHSDQEIAKLYDEAVTAIRNLEDVKR